jgi:hypothetical protein
MIPLLMQKGYSPKGYVRNCCRLCMLRELTANCIIIDHFLHLNRGWSPRFSTLRDETAGFEPKQPEI